MTEFHLQIVTPDGLVFDGMIESLLVPTNDGDVEFLARHIDFIAPLGVGRARIRQQGVDKYAALSGGFVTITGGKAQLIAVTFEFKDDIDIDRARRAKERAKDIISTSNDSKSTEIAKLKLQRALARIKVAETK